MALAEAGVGLVSPNPLVGCVIVSQSGDVVGEGTYIHDDVIHAEAIALKQAGENAKGGTAYISLEPHSHHGKTPPCTEALINAGIKRVVAPIEDPNPLVSGKGFEQLKAHGVEVVSGVLADEAAKLNEKFICWHKKQRPFVHLKLAMSLDGRISLNRGIPIALSGETALKRVHEMRHEYDAILVGGNTAFIDNPSLTDRSGKPRRRLLVRVILDNRLQIMPESKLVSTAKETPTIVFTSSGDEDKISMLEQNGVEIVRKDGRDLIAALEELKRRQIQSVLVEGGSEIAGAFCDAGLVDKFTFIFSPMIIGGCEAPVAFAGKGIGAIKLDKCEVRHHGQDIEITGYPATH